MYARYRVLSFTTRAMKPDNFLELTHPLKNTLKSIVMSQVLNEEKFFDALRKLALEKNEPELDKKLGLLFHLNDYIDGKGRFMVVTHGDCGPGNFLFKYEDEDKSKVEHVCMVDFQFCRLGPPVYDLAYFLFSCLSDEDVESFGDLREYYYESFVDYLIR
jgi:thiamine kinase-like enzyme